MHKASAIQKFSIRPKLANLNITHQQTSDALQIFQRRLSSLFSTLQSNISSCQMNCPCEESLQIVKQCRESTVYLQKISQKQSTMLNKLCREVEGRERDLTGNKKIYEIPIEVQDFESAKKISEEDVVDYLRKHSNFDDLSLQLQNTFQQLANLPQLKILQIPSEIILSKNNNKIELQSTTWKSKNEKTNELINKQSYYSSLLDMSDAPFQLQINSESNLHGPESRAVEKGSFLKLQKNVRRENLRKVKSQLSIQRSFELLLGRISKERKDQESQTEEFQNKNSAFTFGNTIQNNLQNIMQMESLGNLEELQSKREAKQQLLEESRRSQSDKMLLDELSVSEGDIVGPIGVGKNQKKPSTQRSEKRFSFNKNSLKAVNSKNSIYLLDSSGSEGNLSSRQRYASEIKIVDKIDFNENIKIDDYYAWKEKEINLEEEKGDLEEQLKQAEFDAEFSKKEIKLQKQTIQYIGNTYQQELLKMRKETTEYENKIKQLEDEIESKDQQCLELTRLLTKQDKEFLRYENEGEKKDKVIRQLSSEFKILENQFLEENMKLKRELESKVQMIEELENSEKNYRDSMMDLETDNGRLREEIEELHAIVDQKGQVIDQLRIQYDEIIKSIQEKGEKDIYEGQVEKMKQIVGEKDAYIIQLENEIDKILKELAESLKNCEDNERVLKEHQLVIDDLRLDLEAHQYEIIKLNCNLPEKISDELHYLRSQIVRLTNQSDEKNKKIAILENKETNTNQLTVDFEEDSEGEEEDRDYCRKLEATVKKYETIISANLEVIEEMQGQVYEYLEDAIGKERECEVLSQELSFLELEMFHILQEKIAVEVENKRMKKMIAAEEKRISALGARLIHAAKDQLRDEQGKGKKLSQNSTIKLRSD